MEQLENHVARLTVELEVAHLEKAKKQAARKLARRLNIPGFRKGKAPYKVIASYVGEAAIIEDALEVLSNDVYKKALDESEVAPYAAGILEDFKLDPQPTLVFEVPLQPTVELGDYESVRADYDPPEITDEDLNETFRRLQEEHALIEESQQPAQTGNRVTIDIHGDYLDDHDDDAEDDHDDHDDDVEDGDDDHHHDGLIHEHDYEVYLDEEREPVPGFAEALVGVVPGDEREFTLTYPDDEDKYGELAGRDVQFSVEVHAVEVVTLPELTDDFAARLTEDEDESLTLLDLRVRIRKNLEERAKQQYESNYVDEVLDGIEALATFAYPEAMINNQIDFMIEQNAQRMNIGVDDYRRLLGLSAESLYGNEDYRNAAEGSIRRALIMRQIMEEKAFSVSDESVEAEIDRAVAQFGDQASVYRSLFDTPDMRANFKEELRQRKLTQYLVSVGRGVDFDDEEVVKPAADVDHESNAESDEASGITETEE